MVEIKILYKGKKIKGFKIQGHAGYAEEGEDIYCAGVSAISQTALIGLLNHLSSKPKYSIEKGWLELELPDILSQEDRKKANLILSTMEAGLRSLQESYPQYIKVLT